MTTTDGIKGSASQATVLVIDDMAENLSLLHAVLGDTYSVKVANSGARGLAIAQSATPPDLILLDISMPVMDGFEVCLQLKANPATSDIPVIFLTGHTDMDHEDRGLELGAADYISKPINPSVVLKRAETQIRLGQLARSLADANQNLRNAERDEMARNDAMNEFESIVAHDMRSSLSVISGYAGLLVKRVADDEQAIGYLTPVREGVKRMNVLAGHWREISKLIRTQLFFEQLDMVAIVHEALFEAMQPYPPESRPAVYVDELPSMRGDPVAVRQLWRELISNSLLSISRSPRAVSAESPTGGEPLVRISATYSDDEIVYRIEDDGEGFAMDDRERIFAPFQRAHEDRIEGAGLGLFIAQQVANRHGGRLWAESTPGQGATFYLAVSA